MPKCVLVHGYDTSDPQPHGKNTVDKLAPFVAKRGWTPVTNFDWNSHWTQCAPHSTAMDREGQRLAKRISAGDSAIGHSTGAAVIYKALCYGAKLRYVILLHANLDSAPDFPTGGPLKRVWVVSSPHDRVVRYTWTIPFNIMGSMGRTGYQGDDSRVTNITRSLKASRMHINMFDEGRLPTWGNKIAELLPMAA